MNLEELHKLRDRAGIKFNKSFNCIDAERNIHLADKDQFFKKFKEKLHKMGYIEDADFDFDVIRHKYPYAERHHIGQTYEWKYFYSTTFEITNELIQYLLRHNFIKDKNATTLSSTEQKEQVLMSWEDVIKHNERKIKKFEEEESKFRAKGQIESADNLLKAIENCKKKIENVKEIMEKTEK